MKPLISFDYAIKYLLRHKSDYDIIESFLSATLGMVGYPPVKIKSLLESESGREESILKRSVADMIVEDSSGEKYILEIERAFSPHFMHKALFNTSRLIVDTLMQNEDYATIKKVLHITILFEASQDMKESFYHGRTLFHCPGSDSLIDLDLASKDGAKHLNLSKMLPEYFVIVVPNFNNIVEKDFDEWLYVMKNSDIYKNSKVPCMGKVRTKLSDLTMTSEERQRYLHYKKEVFEMRDAVDGGILQGIEIGREEGREEGRYQERLALAKKLLSTKQFSLEQIEELTSIPAKSLSSI